MKKAGKYNVFDHTPGSTHQKLMGLIPPNSKVLEFGCASGFMSREMVKRLNCTIVGVELDHEAAQLAVQWCDRVLVGDAMKMDFPSLLGNEKFDVILFADVLEHLYHPWLILQKVKPFLSENGAVVCSIPNIAHGSIRLSLLGGEFFYRNIGLLDDTHIRFFTLETTRLMFENNGYFISRLFRSRSDVTKTEVTIPPLPEEIIKWVETLPEATTYQFILRAVPIENKDAEMRRVDYPGAAKELDAPDIWLAGIRESVDDIVRHIPLGTTFLLLDKAHWEGSIEWKTHKVHPFPELNGQFGGEPADDQQAIDELKRLIALGVADHLVMVWSTFMWLDYYEQFAEFLFSQYQPILENDRIKILRRK